jgi:hypothetical protein
MNRLALASAAVLGLACTAAGPTTERVTGQTTAFAVREGPDDVPSGYRGLVASYLKASLVDPSSLSAADISEPAVRRVGILNGFRRPAVCVRYVAKDRFGAVSDPVTTVYWFRDGQVAGARKRPQLCAGATYGSFPEALGVGPRRAATGARIERQPLKPPSSAGARPASGKPASARPTPTPVPSRPADKRSEYVVPEPATLAPREYVDERRRGSWFHQL